MFKPKALIKCIAKNDWINSVLSQVTSVPSSKCPNTSDLYSARENKFVILKKYLHKYLRLRFNNQFKLKLEHVTTGQKILWVFIGKRNFGDAIMEMSGRVLLENKGFDIDLFTLPQLESLFEDDPIFKNVYSDQNRLKTENYDVVLLQEMGLASIKLKTKYLRNLPYASLFDFFYGPDRNQTYFSYYAINNIFGLNYSEEYIKDNARSFLYSKMDNHLKIKKIIPNTKYISISIGGIDPLRIYNEWQEFFHLLDTNGHNYCICLVGSSNGSTVAESIMAINYKNLEVYSLVGKLSLIETFEVIKASIAFVGCDGGLLHVATAADTPCVALFGGDSPMGLRLTKRTRAIAIQSVNTVNNIPSSQIFDSLLELLTHTPTKLKSTPSESY